MAITVAEPTGDLYRIEQEPSAPDGSIMMHSLTGFVDAGNASRLAVEHLLEHLDHRVIATFDVDQLIDYRSRRPEMVLDDGRWVSFARPELTLYEVTDGEGDTFLLLHGPEPDLQWERFTATIIDLVERFGVRLVVGVNSIPMGVPHTRPVTVTAHATRPDLVAGQPHVLSTIHVPGSAAGLLELRLGESGHDAVGLAVHVPHYLARTDYPASAIGLLERVATLTGLDLPAEALRPAAQRVLAEVERQVSDSEQVSEVIDALERQYDANASARSPLPLLSGEDDGLPTGDELADEVERYLAEQGGNGPSGGDAR